SGGDENVGKDVEESVGMRMWKDVEEV
ncbi:hypothetical protein Pmani_030407, partial [Petrolisthes manimaculis]